MSQTDPHRQLQIFIYLYVAVDERQLVAWYFVIFSWVIYKEFFC